MERKKKAAGTSLEIPKKPSAKRLFFGCTFWDPGPTVPEKNACPGKYSFFCLDGAAAFY
jgi:hypothetical protein